MDISTLRQSLQSARERKQGLTASTDAYRLLNAEPSGVPGLTLELFGSHAVAFDSDGRWREPLRMVGPELCREFGWESLILKDRSQAAGKEREAGWVVAGNPPEKIAIREYSLSVWVELRHPRNVGLFLDTRDLRARLYAGSRGSRVLNLFSYTCSLGLAALAGGAKSVVNVDVSGRYLEWGKENLALNALSEEGCRFQRIDSERYLDWAEKKHLEFDQVILDPPVFSRFEGKTYRFSEDYFRLAAKGLRLIPPGGTLYALTNFSGITQTDFLRELEVTAHTAGKTIRDLRSLPLPFDFDLKPSGENRSEGNALIVEVLV